MTAHRINDLAQRGPFSRSKLFDLVKRGKLRARKIEGVTFVIESDWRAFLEGAPLVTEARERAA